MPRDPFKPLLEKEQKFVFHYIREGCADEKLNLVARRCRLPMDEAKSMLRRAHVQEEIRRRRALVEFEEHKLIARDKTALAREEDERDRVTLSKAEKALNGVLTLEAKDHGAIILKAVELALVYTGTIRNGNTVKLNKGDLEPGQNPLAAAPPEAAGPSFYRSIFAAERDDAEATAPEPVEPPAPLIPDLDTPRPKPQPKAKPAPVSPKKPDNSQPDDIEIT